MIKAKILHKITLLIIISFSTMHCFAQMNVTTSSDAQFLAELLGGPGVEITNAVMVCPEGASGFFNAADSTNLGIGNGVVLTSGYAADTIDAAYGYPTEGVAGPNSGSASFSHNAPGDADLDFLIQNSGFTTNDACVLEFDIATGCADTITFNYVFGSDEYHEFVCSSFNDAFGLLVSGPNPAGGNYTNENVATIPGTTTPVSIDNVNNGTSDFYSGAIEGFPCTTSAGDMCPCNSQYFNGDNGDGFTAPWDSDSLTIQYDGLTVVMQAKFAIVPFATYNLKLAVADAGDWSLDSGVFIEAGSITAATIEIDTQTDVDGYDNLVEGCVNGIIDLALLAIDSIQTDTVCINLVFGGTAINGVDYIDISTGMALADEICILPGDTSTQIILAAVADGLTEGTEFLEIEFISDTCGIAAPPLILEIIDNIDLQVSFSDSSYCAGIPIQLQASGAQEYFWTPTTFIDNDTISNPIVNPTSSQIYTVNGFIGPCTQSQSVSLNLFNAPNIVLEDQVSICNSLPIVLDASASIDADIVSWTPTADLNDATILAPTASPINSTWYFINATNAGNCSSSDSIFLEILDQANADAGEDKLSCNGSLVTLNGSGGTELNWSPNIGLSCYDCANPTFIGTETTTYILTASFAGGQCADTDTVLVQVFGVDIDAGEDHIFCNAGSATIGPEIVDLDFIYFWEDMFGNTYAEPNPTIYIETPDDSTNAFNTLTLTVSNNVGCEATAEVNLTALAKPFIFAGEDDTIFNGNSAILTASGAGNSAFYSWEPTELILGENNQIVAVAPNETTTYTAFGTTENGCTGSANVTIVVEEVPEIFMPTAFSPNGDGQNDILKPFYKSIDELITFQIYDRWGLKVFEANGDFNAFWDGTFNGKMQEVGVYIYYIEGSSLKYPQNVRERGNITLVK